MVKTDTIKADHIRGLSEAPFYMEAPYEEIPGANYERRVL